VTATIDRSVATSPTAPWTPRLLMLATGSRHTLLDGGWWPRSTDPIAELPGLILAIDNLRSHAAGVELTRLGQRAPPAPHQAMAW